VTQLGSLERLVFVIVILERYSTKERCLFLNCSEQAVITARSHALKDLSSDGALGISLVTNGEKLQICR